MLFFTIYQKQNYFITYYNSIFETLKDTMILNLQSFQIDHWPLPVQLFAGTDAVASEMYSKSIDVSGGQLCARDAVALGYLLYRNTGDNIYYLYSCILFFLVFQ